MSFEKISVSHVTGNGKDYRVDCNPRRAGDHDGTDRTIRADKVTVSGAVIEPSTSVAFAGDNMTVVAHDDSSEATVEIRP